MGWWIELYVFIKKCLKVKIKGDNKMRIKFTECMGCDMEDTILPEIVESKTVGDLVQKIGCLDFFVGYIDKSGEKHMFKIYYAGQYLSEEYDKFLKCGKLSKMNLFDDFHDILIEYDGFEGECFIKVVAN